MGRPPCCDKDGIKKGPWTPEEDIILVSYIQEHGPGNWRSVPTNTGLSRCSKSCRLRWTNYLRPGIKRGNFTPHEEGMIIHLQALLGNKWAAIASYLPQRTDNDIKNYWNTHLKKKIKRLQSAHQLQDHHQTTPTSFSLDNKIIINDDEFMCNRSRSDNNVHQVIPPPPTTTTSACYASSTENISRLLENWMKCSPNTNAKAGSHSNINNNNNNNNYDDDINMDHCGEGGYEARNFSHEEEDHLETILSFDNLRNGNVRAATTSATTTTCDSMEEDIHEGEKVHEMNDNIGCKNDDHNNNPPLSFLERWLLDETTSSRQAVEECCSYRPFCDTGDYYGKL